MPKDEQSGSKSGNVFVSLFSSRVSTPKRLSALYDVSFQFDWVVFHLSVSVSDVVLSMTRKRDNNSRSKVLLLSCTDQAAAALRVAPVVASAQVRATPRCDNDCIDPAEEDEVRELMEAVFRAQRDRKQMQQVDFDSKTSCTDLKIQMTSLDAETERLVQDLGNRKVRYVGIKNPTAFVTSRAYVRDSWTQAFSPQWCGTTKKLVNGPLKHTPVGRALGERNRVVACQIQCGKCSLSG